MSDYAPAGRLARLFGNIEAMRDLYAPDVEWTISASLGIPKIKGKKAVVAFNRQVWTEHHRLDCGIVVLDELGDTALSAARFTYRAWSYFAKAWYENEYTLFVHAGPDGIRSVFEAMDSSANLDFLTGQPIGHGWSLLGGGAGEAVESLGRAE